MPEGARRLYDMVGMFGLILLFLVGGSVIGYVVSPFLNFFTYILTRF